MSDIYERDFYAWAMTNAELIRQGRFAEVDAARDTGLDETAFPAACPFAVSQALDPDWWPE